MTDRTERLTRRQQKLADKGHSRQNNSRQSQLKQQHFELKDVYPMTDNQVLAFNAYEAGYNIFMCGIFGSGKSFVSLYLALREIMNEKTKRHKIVIIRSAQPTKQIGHLPGTQAEKISVYEAPYRSICAKLFHRDDAYEILKQKGIIEFECSSFLRGIDIENSIVIWDECQSANSQESVTILSRISNHSRIIVCGDTRQDDLTSERYKEKTGIHQVISLFNNMPSCNIIQYDIDDIVRSGFARELAIAGTKLGIF